MTYRMVNGKVETPEGCEINVAYHCNLGCASCSHLSPAFTRSLADPETIARDLDVLARSFRAQFVKVLGGEPLLHPRLVEILHAVRASGIAPRILVCTNGILLPRAGEDFWAAVDEVEISVYPGRELGREQRERVEARAAEHGVTLTVAHYSHFRYSYSEHGTDDDHLVRRIWTTCQIAHVWRCHTVYEGHFFTCPQSVFIPQVLADRDDIWADALPLADDPGFAQRLLDHLRRPEPLRACRNCMGSVGRLTPHEQRTRRDFRVPQQHTTEELADRHFLTVLEDTPDADDGCAAAPATLLPSPSLRKRS